MHLIRIRTHRRLAPLAAALLALPAFAQLMPPDLHDPDLLLDDQPGYGLQLGARYLHTRFDQRRNALIHRHDYDAAQYDTWEKGDHEGNANGILLRLGKQGGGTFYGQYLAVESQFEWRAPQGYHRVESDGHEIQLGWRQIAETSEDGHWGWTAGYLGLKEDKWLETQERGAFRSGEGDVQWDMLQVGYFGEWTPLLDWLYFTGAVGGRFGEVEGLCRRGSDHDWEDGSIDERYIVDSSLAYGAFARLGLGFQYRGFATDVSYFRTWLYSFDATESGTVVFPDNDDALFVQNDGGFLFRAGYTAAF